MEYRLLFFGDLLNLRKLWQFEILVNTGPCGAGGNFKMLLLQFSFNLSQTLCMRALSIIVEYKLLFLFFGNQLPFTNFVAL